MSEFKFSCPNCQQNIQATSEYSGLQINCPACKTPLVVPAAPEAPAAPATTSGSRLSMAAPPPATPPPPPPAAALNANRPTRRKKPMTGLIVGLSCGAIALAATIYFWSDLMKKVSAGNQATAAAPQPATNAPPPPPPELTTLEILQKVDEAYKGLTDYAATGTTIGDIDMSGFGVPGQKPLHTTTTSSLQLGRTDHYRLEWEQSTDGKKVKGAAWNAGKGNFVGSGASQPSKVKTREAGLATAASFPFFLLDGQLAEAFFSTSNSVAEDAKDFAKTNGPNLNAGENYVLAGEQHHVSMLLWIDKKSFLLTQIKIIFGGAPINAAELTNMPPAERNAMMMMAKLKGSITETYSNIRTNQDLLASAFESAYKPDAAPAAARKRAPASPTPQSGRKTRGQ
jgi:hypothetical protein